MNNDITLQVFKALDLICDRTDIEGLGGKTPTVDIAVEVLYNNCDCLPENFVSCGIEQADRELWAEVKEYLASPANREKLGEDFKKYKTKAE